IKNYCYKEKSDTTSDARGYLDTESVLVVDDGDMYVILKFTHGKMMSDTSVKVEGKSAKIKTVKESGNKYYIRFEINSLSDEIMVTSTIDTGVPAIGVIKGVKFRVILRESTLKEDDDAADFDDEEEIEEEETTDEEVKVEEPVQDGIIVIPPSSEITDNNTAIEGSKKSTYKVNNEIVTDSQIGYQAARGAVNKTSFYEIIDDKKYMTLGFSQTDILNNIRISNNAQNIPYTVVSEDKSNHTLNIRFEIPSISTQLTVTANVTAMGRDISFGLKFLESTLQLISTEEYENISNNTESNENSSSSGILSGLSSTMSNLFSGGSSSEGNIEVAEEAAEDLASLAKEYFKKYTISNEVISDSAIGRTMARKYLSETSIIEEIDGQFYATITFSSASSMGDFKIEVNGETVSHTVPLKDMGSDLISLRFPISSVNDDIRTYIFISPMKMTIDFGIKFLEDTMTLIDEGTIGEEENSESSSLAETLSNLNQTSQSNKNQMSTVKVAASTSVMVIVLNQGVAGIGSLFRRFKNKSLLSKITNIE
ncbi:MAG: NEAT domain-containing protein, partial [Clostridium sp.]|nr:NEAT domain-containing protein [Clostridium sp.]